jgi:hypothetical protein
MFTAFLRPRVTSFALLCSIAIAAPAAAHADHCHPTTKIITVTEYVRQPVQVTVIRYDHCGRARKVTVTEYRTVKVTITKRVPIHH